jgi:hypothetical protein
MMMTLLHLARTSATKSPISSQKDFSVDLPVSEHGGLYIARTLAVTLLRLMVASVAAMSGGPRSSPRQTPRTRVQLDPGKSFSKYASASNSSSPGPGHPEQRAADVTTDPGNLRSINSKGDDTTSIHSNDGEVDSLPPAALQLQVIFLLTMILKKKMTAMMKKRLMNSLMILRS